eukprot:gnl/MRDRNA2_/MRDRNA2_118737_c0_seq1.p1 gnl/MRDRNA2_/MRDRNA2_118737_c0~~gnl/MRDRNA2_/MRDRNA2_118737_c0_seq1.p1  ORF type:complete len:171 (+),score=45.75 gnl/MRDRNA2_/MRDRNA2_118737_c0_seq1:83-595(+)
MEDDETEWKDSELSEWSEDPELSEWTEDIWCKCCGRTGHEKKDCLSKDKECSICGKTGHLKVMCRQAMSWQQTPTKSAKAAKADKAAEDISILQCRCCGKTGHVKKNCKFINEECRICGKVGHLKAVCREKQTPYKKENTFDKKPNANTDMKEKKNEDVSKPKNLKEKRG